MAAWVSAELWLRQRAEEEAAQWDQLVASRTTAKPPSDARSMVTRERTRRRNRAAEVHGRPIGDIATQGRT